MKKSCSALRGVLCAKKTYRTLLLCLFCLFPIIEIYRSFLGNKISVCGFAVEELFILLCAAVLFLASLVFAWREGRRKAFFAVLAFFAVAAVYIVLHSFHIVGFHTAVFALAEPDFIIEGYYLGRMYLVPFSLISSAFLLGVTLSDLVRVIKVCLWEIVLCVVITDLLGVSFTAYREGQIPVEGGFFTWFTLPETSDFVSYTAKGFFTFANGISAVFFAMIPVLCVEVMRKGKWYDFLLLALSGLCGVMLSTKVATLGWAAMTVCGIVIVFLDRIRRREKKIPWLRFGAAALLVLLWVPLLLNSPGWKMQKVRQESSPSTPPVTTPASPDDKPDDPPSYEVQELEAYLAEHYADHNIQAAYLTYYPVENDPEFWEEVISRDNSLNENRRFRVDLMQRIARRNDNALDPAFGMGYTANLLFPERDYAYQYYLYGFLGLFVLVAPFFLLFASSGVKTLFAFARGKKIAARASVLAGLFGLLAVAYLSGYVFDTILSMYMLALFAAAVIAKDTENP